MRGNPGRALSLGAALLPMLLACTRTPSSTATTDAGPTASSAPAPAVTPPIDPVRELALLAGGASAPDAGTRKSAPTPGPVASSPPTAIADLQGNAHSGMTPRAKLMPLAKPGARCSTCFFNGRCVLLTEGDSGVACCDYAGGSKADAWTPGGAGGLGHAAECLALILEAPTSPAPARGKLLPLAKPDQSCRECFFNGRCQLLVEGASADPCCDYAHGKTAGAWGDDREAATCLATEARSP